MEYDIKMNGWFGDIKFDIYSRRSDERVFHREAAIRATHNYRVSKISQVQFI